MKTKINIQLFSTALILFLSACAPSGGTDSDKNSQYQKDVQKLNDNYSQVVGTYDGSMEILGSSATGDRESTDKLKSFPLQLGIYTELASTGKDSNGQEQILPVLKIRYRQMDIVRADEILSGRFVSETGELTATSATASKDGSNSSAAKISTSIKAQLSGNRLTGEVVRGSGKLGKFDITLTSKNVLSQADANGELYDRLVKFNRSLQGIYEGKVTAPAGQKSFPAKIQITAFETATDGYINSTLQGYYTRPDFTADPTAGERYLKLEYRFDTDPAQLVMTSSGGTTSVPNAFFMSISGYITNGTFEGEVYDRRGYVGHMVVTKKANPNGSR